MEFSSEIESAAAVLRKSKFLVAFSGAGMSAESGIPTFRDPGGIWDQFDPEEIGTAPGLMQTLTRVPDKIRSFLEQTLKVFLEARPNPGHVALGTLERLGLLRTVITQNVDNLHQEAGNTNVLEMHGNLYRQCCLACGRRKMLHRDEFLGTFLKRLTQLKSFDLPSILRELPRCACGNSMRPDVVMFGEQVQKIQESFEAAARCTAMLILGTSGVVYPAAALPQKAKAAGATVIEINPGHSSYYGMVDVRIQAPTGQVLPRIVERMMDA
ncbi:MAG: NAD-dependent deacylase [bacterium]